MNVRLPLRSLIVCLILFLLFENMQANTFELNQVSSELLISPKLLLHQDSVPEQRNISTDSLELTDMHLLPEVSPPELDGDDEEDDEEDEDDEDDDDEDDEVEVHPTLYFVELDSTTTEAEIQALLIEMNSIEVWSEESLGIRLWEVLSFPYTTPTEGTITNINAHIRRARKRTKISESDPNIAVQVPIDPVGNPGQCFNQMSWDFPQGTESVKIAILDTGIASLPDGGHPDYHFQIQGYTGYDYIDNDFEPDDLNGHGTKVAGIINHILAPYNINGNISFDIRKTHDAQGQGYVSALVPAIVDAVEEGADILNMSFSYLNHRNDTLFRPLALAIHYAEEAGALVVAAAGNEGTDNDYAELSAFPATYQHSNIISVASNDCDDQMSAFTNYGLTSVDVSFLGESIPGPDMGTGLTYNTGSSYSTAIVSAMAAILGTRQDDFDHNTIKCVLTESAIYSASLADKIVSNGVIDFAMAYEQFAALCNGGPIPRLAQEALSTDKMTIYPNPAENLLQIQLSLDKNSEIRISVFNDLGQLLYTKETVLANGTMTLSIPEIAEWPKGLYRILATTPEGLLSSQSLVKL